MRGAFRRNNEDQREEVQYHGYRNFRAKVKCHCNCTTGTGTARGTQDDGKVDPLPDYDDASVNN